MSLTENFHQLLLASPVCRPGEDGGWALHHGHTQRPLTLLGRQTDEASSSWWKLSIRYILLSCDNLVKCAVWFKCGVTKLPSMQIYTLGLHVLV